MKSNAIVRIVLYSLAILVLLGILLTGIGIGSFLTDYEFTVGNFTINLGGDASINGTASSSGTVSAEEVKNISIQWAVGSITIQPGDVETITFSESGRFDEENCMVWNKNGSTLEIRFSKPQVFFGFSYQGSSKDLVITVPRNWSCGTLEIETASAKMEIRDLSIRNVDFDGASGEFNLENCSVDELDIDTASGDVHFTGTLNTLECDAASADVTAVLSNVPKSIDMDMASGDLDLTLPENSGFTVSLDALSGRFSSDFATTNNGGYYVCGDGSCKITFDGMSGDIYIRKG